jgi:DNA repair protein RecO (recombination protein O)
MGELRQTLAVVIRTADYKDNDRMITLLTKDYGKMSASVRGARKPTSKLFAAASLFCCGEYMFYEKDGRYGVKSCTVRRTFFNMQNDYDAYAAACFIAEAVDKVAQEDNVSPGVFALTIGTLYALDTGAAPGTALCYFVQRLLHIEGVYPNLKSCVFCGRRDNLARFSAEHGGAVCAACGQKHGGSSALDAEILEALARMALTSPGDIAALDIAQKTQEKLKKALVTYLMHVLQKTLKTAAFVLGNGKSVE